MVFVWVPTPVPVTLTEKVQDVLPVRVAPESMMVDEPAIALIVPPPHDPVNPLGVDTTNLDGSVSVNATPVAKVALGFGFETTNVNDVEAFRTIFDDPKALVMVNGTGINTKTDAVPAVPFGKSVAVIGPVVFITVPRAVPVAVTLTEKVQFAPPARVAPERLMVPEPAVAVGAVPLHVPLTPLGVDTTNPFCNESLNDTRSAVVVEFGFEIMNVNDVEAPTATNEGPNALLMVNGIGLNNDPLATGTTGYVGLFVWMLLHVGPSQ